MTVRLYIGNLPEEVDRQALEELFNSAGEVISTKVIRDRKTGKCRGFGFLTVGSEEQAEQYIQKFNGHEFGDNTLRIEIAQPRNKGENAKTEAPIKVADKVEKAHRETAEPITEGEAPAAEATPTPTPTPTKSSSGGGGGGKSSKKRNRGNRSQDRGGGSSSSGGGGGTQPDPRWASQLQRIKEQLQAAGQP